MCVCVCVCVRLKQRLMPLRRAENTLQINSQNCNNMAALKRLNATKKVCIKAHIPRINAVNA